MSDWSRGVGLALLWLAAPSPLAAQGRTAAVSGVVRDQNAGALTSARVTIRNTGTGIARTVLTDGEGRYRAPFLEPGEYAVTAEHQGFNPSVVPAVTLTLDREAALTHTLTVAGVPSSVSVTASAQLVDASAAAISSVVGAGRIEALPLNGRDYVQLAVLQPGVHLARAQVRNSNTGFGLQLSIAGSRPVQNNFRLDGVSLTSYTGSTPGSINGLNLGVDAIREFSVLSSSYSAEYGRAAGGVVNAVTRSGTNQLHGTWFYFHRNDNLDARNFFDRADSPEFRRHQFGASAGGPVARNKTFWFAAYEGLRQARGNTTLDTTLSDEARQGRLRGGLVRVDPAVAKLLELYPRPNGEVFGDTGLFVFPNAQVAGEDFVTVRADHLLGSRDSLFARYTLDDAARTDDTTFALGRRLSSTRQQSAVLEETHLFSPRLLRAARLAFARTRGVNDLTRAQTPGADNPELAFLPGWRGPGIIEVPGLSLFPGGSGALDADIHAFNSLQYHEDWSWTRGRHALRFGAGLERTHFNTDSQNRQSGEFRFRSIADFLTNKPDRFRAQLPGSDTVRGHRQWIADGYIHDTWRLAARLNLELGLRHEWATVPTEVNGKIANLDRLDSPRTRTGGPLFDNPSRDNFAPRAGLAWDALGTGRTVIRAGYGIFHDLLLSQFLILPGVRNPPFFLRADTRNLSEGDFPKGGFWKLVGSPTIDFIAERLPRDMNQPYVQQWNFNLQQKITPGLAARLAYLGSHGVHLSTLVEDANLAEPVILPDGRRFYPQDGQKPNPNFSMIRNRLFDGQSFYHALQTAVEGRFSPAVQWQAVYTWAKNIDDCSATFAQTEADNAIGIPVNGDHKFNRGLSNHDVRHHFTGNAVVSLPAPRRAAFKRLLGEWQLSTIVALAAGVPFSATLEYDAARTRTARPSRLGGQRPDLRPGASNNPVTGDPARWFDPGAFQRPADGFLGNLGRNTMIGPGLASWDVELSRQFALPRLGERARLQWRLEAFNLPNHANFDLPTPERMQVFTSTSVREDAGRITSAGASREIQFGVKLTF